MVVFKRDPCGILCIVLTYAAICYADYVIVRYVVMTTMAETLWGTANVVAFNVCIFLMIMSHLRAVFSDPGTVPLPTTSLDFSDMHAGQKMSKDNGWTVCMKCETYRPPRAHHCRVCRRCIRRMDHHCPWINNCVGETNQKYFIQFLIYVGLGSIYSIILVIISFLIDPTTNDNASSGHTRIVHSIVLVVESVLFGVFVMAISCDQIQAIFSDETGVEHVKKAGTHRSNLSRRALLAEVFGRGPMMCWLSPFQSWRPVRDLPEDEFYSQA